MSADFTVTVTVAPRPGQRLVVPTGLTTPEAVALGTEIMGAVAIEETREASTGQAVLVASAGTVAMEVRHRFRTGTGVYPDAMFAPRDTRFTRAAAALVEEARGIAPEADLDQRARAIANAVAAKFTYGHPETRYYEGLEDIPLLGCGLTPGSCVDINTYLVVSLRAEGIAAGYVTGYFFPAEKVDHCSDMHCWVVTRTEDGYAAWDIAHHLKMGTREIARGMNPKPGFRVALAHSMGLDFPDLGIQETKLIAEPMWIGAGALEGADITIRLQHPEIRA